MAIDKFNCYRVTPIAKMDYNNVKKDSNKYKDFHLNDDSKQKIINKSQKSFQEVFLEELTKKK